MKNIRILKSKFFVMFIVHAVLFSSGLFASSAEHYNAWIDLPVIETIEYFTTLMARALSWAWKYAALFGVIGLIWNALKVQMNRMKPVQLMWDTTFKWALFLALVTMYPSITYGFLGIATEMGEKAGIGKELVEKDLKKLYNQAKFNLETADKLLAGNIDEESVKNVFKKRKDTSPFSLHGEYEKFMDKLTEKGITDVPHFDSERDINKGKISIDENIDESQDLSSFVLSGLTLYALKSVCTEKNLDGSDGDDLTDTYIQLQTYLVDKDGKDTMFISPAAMMRLSILCGLVMWDRWNYQYDREAKEIESNSNFFTEGVKDLAHFFTKLPQMVELLFCQLVLIIAIAFCMIQYIMTIIEFVIVTSIAAIFLPLMLFDGTKDIPKKFIPLMISHMMKITCMIICMYFVMYLLTEHTMNVIGETWGINLFAVAEIIFVAALCYILTQNGPKVAQAIMTGQPQLSMGEALQGAATAAATMGGMNAMAKKAYNGGSTAIGESKKMKAASKAAVGSLGAESTRGQKMMAALSAAGAVASADLKERTKAKFERWSKNSSIPAVDKALQMTGLGGAPSGSGGSGGAGGSSSAHGITGQGKDGKAFSSTSNQSFADATKFDEKTQSQRSMTHKEFNTEKMRQGVEIGSKIGEKMRQKIDEQNKLKTENSNPLPDSLTGETRANS